MIERLDGNEASMTNSRKTLGDPKDEYLDAGANMRQFGNIRFAQMTVFIAMTAGILTALFQANSSLLLGTRIILKVTGLFITIIFWLMDQRAMDYWNHYRIRAIELEKVLGFRQYTNSPARKFFSATHTIRILYFGIVVLWVMTFTIQ